MDWEEVRDYYGHIDLRKAYKAAYKLSSSQHVPRVASEYFQQIEALSPIRSRQVAAVVIATARKLAVG